jgi:cytochrome c
MSLAPRPFLIVLSSLLGMLPAAVEAQDPPASQYQATVLARGLSNPSTFTFLPDGRVYVLQMNGKILLVNPATLDTSTAATLPTVKEREAGLHSLVLDPNFAATRFVYVLFAERTSTDTGLVVARYLTDATTGALNTGSRVNLLRIPSTINTGSAEHNTGMLAFGPEGNLYIALADNTQNIFSGTGNGYAPRDTARLLYDAQRTAANTNDLRGKILRIRPEANGTYTIPAGNLKDSINRPSFNPGWNATEDDLAKVRPEIFVMGLRHPFRMTVDPVTGWVYWTEPGPNASADNASQGPRGYEVVGMAKGPGNYGWPYCRGNPATIPKASGITSDFCYTQYNYSGSGTAGPMYNPTALRNTSKNNTGIVNLPPMRPAQVWYPYATSSATGANFPVFRVNTSGGNAGMLGPVYRYNGALNAPVGRLPVQFDRHIFIVEWQRNLLFVAPLDSAGGIGTIREFRNTTGTRDSVVNGPIDIKIGPDGAVYFLNWVGNNYSTNSNNGTLVRYAYTGTQVSVERTIPRNVEGSLRGRLFASVSGGVFSLPAGAYGVDFHALTGERLWRFRRGEASGRLELQLPSEVRGVVRVRLHER